MTSNDVLKEFNLRLLDFKSTWNNDFSDSYSFRVGDNIKDRILEHKNQQNIYGYPFQS